MSDGVVDRLAVASRSAVALFVALACLLATGAFALASLIGAAAADVPAAPAAVTPARAVVPVTASGPTTVGNLHMSKDTVWGPQGSPYLITGQVFVDPGVALTLLPGTVVKFGTSPAGLGVDGQILSLGSPTQPVVFTSIKDDTVAGDSNGDGNASAPARGDWGGVNVSSQGLGAGRNEVNPVSVFDYTEVSYGGTTSGLNCSTGAMLSINHPDFAGIVNNGLMRGDDVHILTGAHGLPNGTMVADASMYADDVARFGDLPGVTIHDVASLSPEAISGVLQRPGTIIGGFCDSTACLGTFQ